MHNLAILNSENSILVFSFMCILWLREKSKAEDSPKPKKIAQFISYMQTWDQKFLVQDAMDFKIRCELCGVAWSSTLGRTMNGFQFLTLNTQGLVEWRYGLFFRSNYKPSSKVGQHDGVSAGCRRRAARGSWGSNISWRWKWVAN